ncbi:DUF4124 domain-containing protein [Shewanella abyssi]|uniref:DUF4124 domain-containing protein n=1 Tax=Shewanella abyssi TaxID=311789 RepID=UPI00200D7BEF|nr:DUF4124 domain-containing protein [Shewanella abyssi]MCL1048439.1 DUF4124 domain-containing protein [Shewanella abyssi]
MKQIFFTVIVGLFIANNAQAAVYKCTIDGIETYSQDPCSESAEEITVTPPAKMNGSKNTLSEDQLVKQCVTTLTRYSNFKDPESIKLLGYHFDWLQDGSGARRVLQLEINAKNSYGGYGGSKLYPCYLNHSGTQLSKHQYRIFK